MEYEDLFGLLMSEIAARRQDPPGPPYFQVERHPEDDLFLEQICKDEVPWWFQQQNTFSEEDVNSLVKKQVIYTLEHFTSSVFMEVLLEISESTKDYRFYFSAIKTAAQYVYLFYNKECLYKSAQGEEAGRELQMLWDEIAKLGKQGCSTVEVCKLFNRHTVDNKRYLFVTESDLGDMISLYSSYLLTQLPFVFDKQYQHSYISSTKKPMLLGVETIHETTNLHSRMEVDEYSRLLIMIVRDFKEYMPVLLDEGIGMVDVEPLEMLLKNIDKSSTRQCIFFGSSKVDDILMFLRDQFYDLIYYIKKKLVDQTYKVLRPLWSLSEREIFVHQHVYEVIEIAELRRHALGSRFIRRNHLVWAFYECGYGLPPKITLTLKTRFVSEDHPPYHIYNVAIKVAKRLDEKIMRLEHFVFAILYATDKDLEIDEIRVGEMLHQFNEFMKEVDLDRTLRFTVADKQVSQKDLLFRSSFSDRRRLVGKKRSRVLECLEDYNERMKTQRRRWSDRMI